MNNWRMALVPPATPVLEVIDKLDKTALQIALVVDARDKLLGTVTDGDIRRGLLRKLPLEAAVSEVMNPRPVVAKPNTDRQHLLEMLTSNTLKHIPIVDETGCVVGLQTLDEMIQAGPARENWVVIMAGGLGTRLHPLTETTPKPLLKVGDKPILETIIENFVKQDFHRFMISVNYKAEMVKEYFGDGAPLGIDIRYLEEGKRLGTAGALSLFDEPTEEPIVVINGDLLTTVSFDNFLAFHTDSHSDVTIGVREYDFEVPFGVVKLDKEKVVRIDEKPVQQFLVNAGVYVFSPHVLKMVPMDRYMDMPELIDRCLDREISVAAFPIREFWLDVGRMGDLALAEREFTKIFG